MEIDKGHKVYLSEIYIDDLEELGYNWGYDTIQVTNGSFRHLVTLSVIEKWLREEMGVLIEVLWKFTNPNVEYYSKIFYKGTFYETKLKGRYEIAQGDAIMKALDLIKKQKIKEKTLS